MIFSFFIPFLLVSICFPLFAQLPPNIELESDRIEYSKNNHKITAYDDVVLSYQDYHVYTDHFIYDTEDSFVHFPSTLNLSSNSQDIYLDHFYYNFNSQIGSANHLVSTIGSFHITGRSLHFSPKKMTIDHSLFTSCSLPDPHYFISSRHIDVYPHLGFFVARNSRFHFDYLPFDIPIPYYVFGSHKYSLLGTASILPEFGKNNVEGHYVRYKSNYIFSNKYSGTIDLGYSEKLSWLYGGSLLYDVNPRLTLASTYHFYPTPSFLSFYFISKYYLYFPSLLDQDRNLFDSLISPFNLPSNNLSISFDIILQEHLLQSDYWVSHFPLIQFDFLHVPFFSLFMSSSSLGVSSTTESLFSSYSFTSSHAFLRHSILSEHSLNSFTHLEFNTFSFINYYSNHQQWHRIFHQVSFSFDSILSPKISYLKRLYTSGTSPFNYENKYTYTSDEIGLSLLYKISYFELKTESFYALSFDSFRRLELSFNYLFHCWGLGLTWKTQQNIFNFNFNLF